MFLYYWTYMNAIGNKLQNSEKLKRWLTNPNGNFDGTKVSSNTTNTTTYDPLNETKTKRKRREGSLK